MDEDIYPIEDHEQDSSFCERFSGTNSTENPLIPPPENIDFSWCDKYQEMIQAIFDGQTPDISMINTICDEDATSMSDQHEDPLNITGKEEKGIDGVCESQDTQKTSCDSLVDSQIPLSVQSMTQGNNLQHNSNASMTMNTVDKCEGNKVANVSALPNPLTRQESTSILSHVNQVNSGGNSKFPRMFDAMQTMNSSGVMEYNMTSEKSTAMLSSNDLANGTSALNQNVIHIACPNLTVLPNEAASLIPQTQNDSHIPLHVHAINKTKNPQQNSNFSTTMNTGNQSGEGQFTVNFASTNLSLKQGGTCTLTQINQGKVVDVEDNRTCFNNTTMMDSNHLQNVASAVNSNGFDVTHPNLTDFQDQKTTITQQKPAPCTKNRPMKIKAKRTGNVGRCPQGVLPLYLQSEPENEEDKKKWHRAKNARKHRESKKSATVSDANTIKELKEKLAEKDNQLNSVIAQRDALQYTLDNILKNGQKFQF